MPLAHMPFIPSERTHENVPSAHCTHSIHPPPPIHTRTHNTQVDTLQGKTHRQDLPAFIDVNECIPPVIFHAQMHPRIKTHPWSTTAPTAKILSLKLTLAFSQTSISYVNLKVFWIHKCNLVEKLHQNNHHIHKSTAYTDPMLPCINF